MDNKPDNSEAYGAIRWVLDNGDMGFFFVIAPPGQQRKIAYIFSSSDSAIYDYSKESKPYSYTNLSKWAEEHSGQRIFFVLNMDAAFHDENHMASLNMSRDMLTNKEKIWFFCMTEDLKNHLSDHARDFYSYVRLKVHFNAEEEDEFEGKHIMDFNDRHNVQQIRETLSRYKDLETRYMAMTFEDNTENELFSAAITLTKIAVLYADCAEYDKALKLLKKTKKIREKILGYRHPDIAETYNNIAYVYDVKGDYNRALNWYQKSLYIFEKILGKNNSKTATIYNNIAYVYYNIGDFCASLDWHQKALEIREKTLGKDHPDTAATYNNIALVYYSQGEYSIALDCYQKALPVCEKTLGKDHPHTTVIYNNIAGIYTKQGDYSKALDWHQKALEACKNIQGEGHPNTATIYYGIALVYHKQGDNGRALELLQKAHEIFLHRLGEEHPNTVSTKRGIQNLSIK